MRSCLFVCLFLLGLPLWAQEIPDGYYDGTENLRGDALKAKLHDIIKGHKTYSYGQLWDILSYTDEDPNNTSNVIFLYTGWSKPKNSHGGDPSDWNREHTWAKSRGNFGTQPPAGTDAHHLRPTDVTVNSKRGSLDFDEGGELYRDPDGPTECRVDGDSWEPRDAVKGDVARMLFYMVVRYEGGDGVADLELVDQTGGLSKKPLLGKLSALLKWHAQDPPDDFEKRRNERVYEYQYNRNPFIDHPEFVKLIWGGPDSDGEIVVGEEEDGDNQGGDAEMPADYYNGTADLEGDRLKQKLHDIIKDHRSYRYSELWGLLAATDSDPDNLNNVLLFYSGWSRPSDMHGGQDHQWNREHVWPKSRGQFDTDPPAGTDLHNIHPTDVSINRERGHLEFDWGGVRYNDADGPTENRYDLDSWEPPNQVKGDVARVLFYMAVRYEGGDGVADLEVKEGIHPDSKEPVHGSLRTLLRWHREDPVDAFERRRNDKVFKHQKNRNPFIDHPEFVEKIWKVCE